MHRRESEGFIMKLILVGLLMIAATESFQCKPGTNFKFYCNTCTCSNDGKSGLCTLKGCNHLIWNEDGSIKPIMNVKPGPGQICNPHSSFMEYCNRCRCSDDGKYKSCTSTICEPGVWNKNGTLKTKIIKVSKSEETDLMCKPYSTFKDYCNTCKCLHDGKSKVCTFVDCDSSLWNKDGTFKVEMKDPNYAGYDDVKCEPHSVSHSYCNICKCQADGKNVDCTFLECDPRVWNEDGSMKTFTESADHDYFG